MPSTYSQDLRDRVLAAADRGMETRQIATLFCVSPAWVRRVKQRRREHGETSARPVGKPKGAIIISRERLAALVREHPDATGPELQKMLGIECSVSGIYAALKELGITRKKKRSTRRSRIVPTSSNAGPGGGPGRSTSPLAD